MPEDKNPYIAPNGRAIVKMTTHRYGLHHPGEVAGFEPEIAAKLVAKGYAVYVDPPAAKPAPPPATTKDQRPSGR